MNQQAVAEVFSRIQEHRGAAGLDGVILAGGAIRDWLNQRPISDYDIYIRSDRIKDQASWPPRRDGADHTLRQLEDWVDQAFSDRDTRGYFNTPNNAARRFPADSGAGMPYVRATSEFMFQGLPLNLIFLNCDPHSYIRRFFDIGLCECWMSVVRPEHDLFDLDPVQINTTRNYQEDLKNNTLTVRIKQDMTPAQIGRTFTHHLPKVMLKYPEFTLRLLYPPTEQPQQEAC